MRPSPIQPRLKDQNRTVRGLGLYQAAVSLSQSARALPAADIARPGPEQYATRSTNSLRDGKLYLSINDAVALALENNLDIAIQRYNMAIADTDILRAKAGGSTLGVNSGIVTDTPGGGTGGLSGSVGSGTGGTSAGSGGAGTGAGGLVNSTLGSGPAITSFDPVLSGSLQMDRLYHPVVQHFQPYSGVQSEYRNSQLQLPARLSRPARTCPWDSRTRTPRPTARPRLTALPSLPV